MKLYNECQSIYGGNTLTSLPFHNDGGHAVYAIKFEGGAGIIITIIKNVCE